MPTIVEERRQTGVIPPPVWPGSGGGDGGSGGSGSSFPISKNTIGLWILLGTIIMLFAGLSSAYIVLRGVADWQSIEVPSILWLNERVMG